MPFDNPNTRVEIATNEEELAILRGAREILTSPQNWAQGNTVRTNVVERNWFLGPKKWKSYCALGAVSTAAGCSLATHDALLHADHGPAHRNVVARLHELAGGSVVGFNDCRTARHQDVVALFDRAIVSFE